MKFNFPYNNFTSGEWSPKLRARTDTEQYTRACESLKNMFVQIHGGASFRGGLRHMPIVDTTVEWAAINAMFTDYTERHIQLIPYIPSNRAYSCMFFVGFRRYSGPTPPSDVKPLLLAIRTELGTIDPTIDQGVGTGANLNDVFCATVNLGSNTNLDYAFSDFDYCQVGDLLILTSKDGAFPPMVFYADASGNYYIKRIDNDFITNRPWETIPWSDIEALGSNKTITPSGTTGTINLTFSGPVDIEPGSYIRLCLGTSLDGIVRINSGGTFTVKPATVLQTIPSAGIPYGATSQPTSFWQQSAWTGNSTSSGKGWPRTVTAFQSRVLYGGNLAYPDTLWGSRTSDFFYMQEVPSPDTTGTGGFSGGAYTSDNSRAFTLTPNSKEASNIVALSSAKTLTIHTDRSEIVAYGSNGGLGPTNVVYESSTSYGGAKVRPVRVNNYLTFVQKTGRNIRDIIFNFNEDQYKSTNLGFVAEHLFRQGTAYESVKEMTTVEGESSILYVRTTSGRILAVTLDRDYQISAWARMEIGKGTDDNQSFVPAEAICTFPNPTTGVDTLWVLTKRKYGATYKYHLEMKVAEFDFSNPVGSQATGAMNTYKSTVKPNYLDFSTEVVTTSTTAVSSFDLAQLIGGTYTNDFYKSRTLSVVLDGNYIGEYTTDANGILNTGVYSGFSVVVGYKYQGILKTMPIEQGGQVGTPMGRIKRIDECIVRLFNTVGALIGPDASTLQDIVYRESTQPMDTGVDFFSGDKLVSFDGNYDRELQVMVVQNNPYPCNVLAVIPRGLTYD